MKSEIRNPKSERSPKSEVRTERVIGFVSELGFSRARSGFTMIELILVMAILTIAVSITAPALANFFRGRSLDSVARRMLALTRLGQSRAVSEGVPMELWFDLNQGSFGLEAEPSYEPTDAKAVEFTLDTDVQLELYTGTNSATLAPAMANPVATLLGGAGSGMGNEQTLSRHPNLPTIRFLCDGTITETSPQALRLTGRDGISLWVAQTRNRLSYEVRNRLD